MTLPPHEGSPVDCSDAADAKRFRYLLRGNLSYLWNERALVGSTNPATLWADDEANALRAEVDWYMADEA